MITVLDSVCNKKKRIRYLISRKLNFSKIFIQLAKSTACNGKLMQHFDDISENLINSSKNSVKEELTDNFKVSCFCLFFI